MKRLSGSNNARNNSMVSLVSPKSKQTQLIERVLNNAGKYDGKNYKSPRNLLHRGPLDKNSRPETRNEKTMSIRIDLANNSNYQQMSEQKNQTQSALYNNSQYAYSPRNSNMRCASPSLTQRATITLSHWNSLKSIDFNKMTSRFRSDDVHAEWESSRRASIWENKSPDKQTRNSDANLSDIDQNGGSVNRMHTARTTQIDLFNDSLTQGLQQSSSFAKIERYKDLRERDFSSQIQTLPGPRSPSNGRQTLDYVLHKSPQTIHVLDQKIHESEYFKPEIFKQTQNQSSTTNSNNTNRFKLRNKQNIEVKSIKIGENLKVNQTDQILSSREVCKPNQAVQAQIDVIVQGTQNFQQKYQNYQKGIKHEDNRPKRIQYQMHDFIYKTNSNFLCSDQNQ